MARTTRVLVAISLLVVGLGFARAGYGDDCAGTYAASCGVAADHVHGDFHGLIAINGQPSVLHLAAHAGTESGCADCVWTIVSDCATSDPRDPGNDELCIGATRSPTCRHGIQERLYLSDKAAIYQPEGTICLHHGQHVIPVGDRARADVARYLKNVTPPDLRLTSRPRQATLAGLRTYFTTATPTSLHPRLFGGPDVHETIKLLPQQAAWDWGDGDSTGWIDALTTQTHRYNHGGVARGSLQTRWGASYTVTYQGLTFGPYDATGRLTKRQTFTLPVRTSRPVLVSH